MSEKLYLTHDNTIVLQLLDAGVPVDLDQANVIEVKFADGVVVSSEDNLEAFDWTAGDGKLTLKLGEVATIPNGLYEDVWIVVYTDTAENGLVWSDDLNISVLQRGASS